MHTLMLFLMTAVAAVAAPPLRLHPENPRYFEWRGRPTLLVGSGEHYGAVLNLDFDFAKYLAAMERDGLNVTRTFTGAGYVEPQNAFNIAKNTLAPQPGRYLAPWARSDQPGASDGGAKWDLTRWNEEYFTRFKAFVREATARGVVVEVTLFCPFYPDSADGKKSPMWPLSPWNAVNNVNGLGGVAYDRVHTLDGHGGLLEVQERFVRRLVHELQDADNIYYEICNEPYFGGVTVDWQHHVARVIADAQKAHAHPKLISQNIANKTAKVENPSPLVSLFNFHYAYPPVAVGENWDLKRAIGDNETGFRGQADEVYRNEAWDFLLAGGALFNHLDYSFAVGHEAGDFAYPPAQPGGGSAAVRAQFGVLRRFLEGFDFIKMKPVAVALDGGEKTLSVRVLGEDGRAYAAYIHRSAAPAWKAADRLHRGEFSDRFSIEVPAGSYGAEWLDPASGRVLRTDPHTHGEGALSLTTPVFQTDVALRLRRQE
jgi:hypothetical protein